jgi:hypothetical protein
MLLLSLAALAGGRPAAQALEPDATGRIEGEVRLSEAPARRTAERYAGAVPAAERAVQRLPAVVYLEGGPGPTPPAGRPRLAQRDTMFVPGALVVQVGTTVDFPNGDPFFHNVFSYSKAKRFDLGRYPQGEAKQVRFETPGIVKVYCEVHRSMRALIVVVESPFHAVVDEQGRFTIDGVPPGRYTLVVVDADRGTRQTAVTVTARGTANVTVAFR